MRLESLAAAPDRAGKYRAVFSHGAVLRLYRQTVEDFGLYPGKEFTPEEFEALTLAAQKMSAKMRAVRIVSASGVSKMELEHRLVQKGERPEHAKEAVAWMSEMNLLDDETTARQIVERCIAKGYGLARAKQALFEKRIPKEFWAGALADYPEQTDAIEKYLEAHLPDPSDRKAVKRCVDALLRRGHSYGAVRRALEDFSLDSEEFLEE